MPESIDHSSTQQIRIFWEHHLEQWEQNGLSELAYCRKHLLKPIGSIIGGGVS
jgi:hypothetical protein